jgi:hypothetical protein
MDCPVAQRAGPAARAEFVASRKDSVMATTRTTPASAQPRFVQHLKRPEWGVGRVIDVYEGRQRVRFADGTLREFREDVLAPVNEADAPEELRALTDALPPPPVRSAHDRARKAKAVAPTGTGSKR